jgi:hypothetical protein
VKLNDITKPEQVRDLSSHEEGTGIYWFVEEGRVEKLFAPRVTRERARQIAADLARPGSTQLLDAFRWIPDRIEGADKLISTKCAGARCRYSNLIAASSVGKWPLVRTARRSLAFKDSMAFVV